MYRYINRVSLPNLSIDPYVKYGAGVRKSWGERLVGYFQTYITNGGRNGVGLQAGFKFSLGKTKSPKPSMHKSPTIGELPELKKTDFRLNYIK